MACILQQNMSVNEKREEIELELGYQLLGNIHYEL